MPGNRAAGFFLPLPDLPFERFASQIAVVDPLRRKLAHDDALGGNPRMIRARQVQGVVPLHSPPPREDIDLRVVEHMANVQRPGYVGRRDHNRKYRPRRIHVGAKEVFLRPTLCPALFDLLRLICFWNLSRHVPRLSAQDDYYTDASAGGQIRRPVVTSQRVYGSVGGREILVLLDFPLDQRLDDGTQKFLGNDINHLGTHLVENSQYDSLHQRRVGLLRRRRAWSCRWIEGSTWIWGSGRFGRL